MNKSFERVGVSSKRVTKSFERVGVSSEQVIKSFERMQIFFERFTNGCKRNPAQKWKVVKVRFPVHGHIFLALNKLMPNFKSKHLWTLCSIVTSTEN